MCLPSSFIMSSSLAQLLATFSVLLAALMHLMLAFFQCNKHSQRITFARQFLVWFGKFALGSKLKSGGDAIHVVCDVKIHIYYLYLSEIWEIATVYHFT